MVHPKRPCKSHTCNSTNITSIEVSFDASSSRKTRLEICHFSFKYSEISYNVKHEVTGKCRLYCLRSEALCSIVIASVLDKRGNATKRQSCVVLTCIAVNGELPIEAR